ncbi:MAG: hypothetical protein ACQEXB_11625 [Bacillota bacterium]
MGISEYGKELSSIGKEISEMSKTKETDLLEHLRENLSKCKKAAHKLKKIEPPSFVCVEHRNLINVFERLITAYSIQIESANADGHDDSRELLQKGEIIVEEETQKVWPIFISILRNSSHFMFNKN